MPTRRVRLQIRGRVQGVFFRQSALAQATTLGLSGWVRNRASGEVEALAQGAPEQVDAFVAWCRRGPPSAKVEAVDLEEVQEVSPLAPFHVEPTG